MPISHTAHVTLNAPSDDIDLEAWLFELSDADYQTCAKGHRGAGVFADEQGRGMINVESIGGNLIVQHYRRVRADRSSVEMYSSASRVYLFHRGHLARDGREHAIRLLDTYRAAGRSTSTRWTLGGR
jgi:hypothetical protein